VNATNDLHLFVEPRDLSKEHDQDNTTAATAAARGRMGGVKEDSR